MIPAHSGLRILSLVSALVAAGGFAPTQEDSSLAWFRVQRTTRGAQEYNGTPYLWLGKASIRLEIDVRPGKGHTLELLWGSKGDTREAILTVNGEETKLEHGGYDGFRPLRVPVPEGVKGRSYEVSLAKTGEKWAFISEFRLLGAATGAPPPAATRKKPAFKMELDSSPPPLPEAFPEMRVVWDRPLPPPRKPLPDEQMEQAFRRAERNARIAAEQLFRCRRFVDGWLRHADPETGLIPRNLGRDRDSWNAQDAAADNYPFMVLTAALTDRSLFEGRLRDILRTEIRLTSRIDRLPDTWSFSKQGFRDASPDLARIIFGSSEYVKDGLLPLTEWLGPSPWSDRMVGLVDDIWKHAPVETPRGRIPSTNVEVNGEMLQALSRTYWLTGEKKYLEYALRLGDYYLLGEHHPTRDFEKLRLRDHGCEIVSGLSELYAMVHYALPEKKEEYRDPIHEMFDRILEVGRDERGMLYNTIYPKTGRHDAGICDTWGYNYNGVYTVYLLDGTEAYRRAVREVLSNLKEHLTPYHWGSADEYADSIEGAINLYNREPVPTVAEWIDSEMRDLWSVQKTDGVIEGWHGDGNSARTAIMYALWRTQGLTARPWRTDIRVGSVFENGYLHVSLYAKDTWKGKLLFDRRRHKEWLRLPLDYPRINQFPEWFTVDRGKSYRMRNLRSGSDSVATGAHLLEGLPMELEPGEEVRLVVVPGDL